MKINKMLWLELEKILNTLNPNDIKIKVFNPEGNEAMIHLELRWTGDLLIYERNIFLELSNIITMSRYILPIISEKTDYTAEIFDWENPQLITGMVDLPESIKGIPINIILAS